MERGNVYKIFPDTDFEHACQELENQHIDGWEFFTESHGITIYRLYNEQSGLYEYKIYGTLDDWMMCYQMYVPKFIWTWSTEKHGAHMFMLYETQTDDKKVIYWNVKYPWPMSNRDETNMFVVQGSLLGTVKHNIPFRGFGMTLKKKVLDKMFPKNPLGPMIQN